MLYRVLKGVLVLAACIPAVAPAQQRPAPAATPIAGPHREGSWELSVGAGGTYLDQQLIGAVKLTDPSANRVAPGGAIRFGFNFDKMWNLSVGTFAGYTKPAWVIQPFAAITWTPSVNWSTSPFLTVGGGVTNVSWRGYRVTSQYGAHVGAGIRLMLGERMALRLEAREQYEKFKDVAVFPNAVFNGTATVGFSWFIGGGPPTDSDGDGVPDTYDRCPNTPRGAMVDARGCPIDSDQDGVPDGLDQCPNTPAGVQVDARGCPVDSDGDGVPDSLDRCPNTPSGVGVDANGCPVDSDGDGVPDYLDRCPDTPHGAPVDANGCPKDSDGDGVPDYLDRCPNTPHGVPVDASGCPADSDHDGVPDYQDRCPNTPPNTRVDATGCPIAAPPPPPPPARVAPLPVVNATLVLRNVVFRPNSARLPPEALADLDAVAAAIQAVPNARWEIGGHTSSMGNAARNLRLSQRRALAVRRYLARQGVPAASLVSVGYGSVHPIASNGTAAGRRQNMRVEIKRLR